MLSREQVSKWITLRADQPYQPTRDLGTLSTSADIEQLGRKFGQTWGGIKSGPRRANHDGQAERPA